MKKILYFIFAALLLVSCGEKGGKDKVSLEEQLYGEWHSTRLPVSGDVYIQFGDDKTFELYQKIGEGSYRLYRGTWNLEEDLLTGKYNDGEGWATAYQVVIAEKVLTMTSQNDAAEVTTYESCTIPEEVKDGCQIVVKSSDGRF